MTDSLAPMALARRSSTRRGALIAGSRRSLAPGSPSAAATAPSKADAKTQLVAEFRAHEEDCAARVLQRAAKGFLGRLFVRKLLLQVYTKQYDPIEKKYFYLNTQTNETSWDKPRAVQLFLPAGKDVRARTTDVLVPGEAARRIQRLGRVFLALRAMKRLLRDNYMKLFSHETNTFYYLNTRTGARADSRPPFLRRDSDDLPVETFLFRKAVCKVATSTNLHGSGVLGRFCGVLCLLSDGRTLASEDVVRNAHVVCNYAQGSIPFVVTLTPARLFARMELSDATPFTLCAVDEAEFRSLAGNNVAPLSFELTDRKMGCADGRMKLQDVIEVVGHPHGKLQVVHTRVLARMLPHSIAPLRMQYDRDMESGAAGSAVFTRGGKLLGLQHFTPLKEPAPREFYYIRPILDAAIALVTPPEPFLLATCIGTNEVHAYWQVARWFKPLPGLALEFELEICRHDGKDASRHSPFERVYRGPRRSKHVGALESGALYSMRCRCVNAMARSPWSTVMRFLTPPPPSLAWRVRYCTTVVDAYRRLRRMGQSDPEVHGKCVLWLQNHVEKAMMSNREAALLVEAELVKCGALELVVEAMSWDAASSDRAATRLATLSLLSSLAQLHSRTQLFLAHRIRITWMLDLLLSQLPPESEDDDRAARLTPRNQDEDGDQDQDSDTELEPASTQDSKENSNATPDPSNIRGPGMELLLAGVALLGHVVDACPSGQQVAMAADAVPLVLSLLRRRDLRTHTLFAAECCFLLGRYSHDHTHEGKWEIFRADGLRVLRDVMRRHAHDSRVLYWSLATLGNVAYGCGSDAKAQLETETDALRLINVITRVRMRFLVRLNELELELMATEKQRALLQAQLVGEDMRNELDACEHAVVTLQHAIEDYREHDVAQAADFALRYVLSETQQRVQQASRRLMTQFLLRKLASAYATWCTHTVWARHCAIFRGFLTAVRHRQLTAGFRRWETAMREWRRHHRSVLDTLGTGFAIDLNKGKRERYRMLVLQK